MKRIARTKAKTAWDLLNEVCRIIEAEPQRYNQGQWVRLVEKDNKSGYTYPECGTIGCVAGWVDILTEGRKQARADSSSFIGDNLFVAAKAAKTLGITHQQADDLFDGEALQTTARVFGFEGRTLPDKGTQEYAALGVAHIYRFMHRNERRLRSKRVKVQ
jgi:hypothetical protein